MPDEPCFFKCQTLQPRLNGVLPEGDDEEDMVEFLLEHPYQVATFTPLTRDEIHERR